MGLPKVAENLFFLLDDFPFFLRPALLGWPLARVAGGRKKRKSKDRVGAHFKFRFRIIGRGRVNVTLSGRLA